MVVLFRFLFINKACEIYCQSQGFNIVWEKTYCVSYNSPAEVLNNDAKLIIYLNNFNQLLISEKISNQTICFE